MPFDYLLVGGGLQNGLLALALLTRRPGTRVALVERGPALGGNHTWCFFAGDVSAEAARWLAPLVVRRWPDHEVRFPGLRRVVRRPYAAITSAQLDRVVRQRLAEAPGCAAFVGATARAVDATGVTLADGRRLSAGVVVDARGPHPPSPGAPEGYQKFLGREVRLRGPVSLARPVVMDATVPQRDGYRFFYLLPFTPERLLVEETFFSDEPRLDIAALRRSIDDYLARRGLAVAEVLREEAGVLAMPWRGGGPAAVTRGPVVAGYGGGWFHPATGYSLPVAVRVAETVAVSAPALPFRALAALRRRHARQAHFARFLNWGLFRATPPDARWRLLRRFYRLPEEQIERFYRLDLRPRDGLRFLLSYVPEGFGRETHPGTDDGLDERRAEGGEDVAEQA